MHESLIRRLSISVNFKYLNGQPDHFNAETRQIDPPRNAENGENLPNLGTVMLAIGVFESGAQSGEIKPPLWADSTGV
ncbi:hypothetical protein [Leptolyngbya iicbica]|uniref:Uncharacterized protein n=2 Tax=Cyanophyceae TaxID=3028117 RepID=A0A4Q7E3A0_9CYAN|nr:hypothetical protein [Leptolyngbya sp. LK]RZM76008.1 hypothetical protein DYY88_19110 [Leptolyngbya sp. LK]